MPTSEDVTAVFSATASRHLHDLSDKIRHCVGQLSDDQIWWRPSDSQNSIANLILHLIGNVRQWIVSGAGGAPDHRDRPAEFSDRSMMPRDELLRRLNDLVAEAAAVIDGLSAENAVRVRRIQGFDNETGLTAIFHSVAHFYGHTQEIIHMTRTQLGDAYQHHWKPTTPEEGAG